ncbi:hypothetical protein MAR_024414 [Mya arenaria]|uniref:Transmembrane protein n=1 Tax=Mya arenaria TaxID=6604 RepID=A0ABY7DTW0_MYAAR|nr:uncharacterized protein LOC128228636 [Mya arenaria]WAR00042.1 hypothetical protein MAR_024414 [Mya arenaria]
MAMSKLQAVAVWLLDIGYMLQVVGISPLCWNWYNARVCIALGLWDIDLYPNSVWLTATKTLEATGVGFGLFALLIVFSLVCLPRFYHWTVMLVAIFSSVIAGVSILTGIGIYANKLRHVFDFSSAPNCTAGLLFILAGGLLAIDVCRIRQHNSRAHTQTTVTHPTMAGTITVMNRPDTATCPMVTRGREMDAQLATLGLDSGFLFSQASLSEPTAVHGRPA